MTTSQCRGERGGSLYHKGEMDECWADKNKIDLVGTCRPVRPGSFALRQAQVLGVYWADPSVQDEQVSLALWGAGHCARSFHTWWGWYLFHFPDKESKVPQLP